MRAERGGGAGCELLRACRCVQKLSRVVPSRSECQQSAGAVSLSDGGVRMGKCAGEGAAAGALSVRSARCATLPGHCCALPARPGLHRLRPPCSSAAAHGQGCRARRRTIIAVSTRSECQRHCRGALQSAAAAAARCCRRQHPCAFPPPAAPQPDSLQGMAFEMSLPHAPRIRVVAPDGGETHAEVRRAELQCIVIHMTACGACQPATRLGQHTSPCMLTTLPPSRAACRTRRSGRSITPCSGPCRR